MKIIKDFNLCKNCKKCIGPSCCPMGAFYVNTNGDIKIDQTKCVGCCLCVNLCPFNALKNEEQKSLL